MNNDWTKQDIKTNTTATNARISQWFNLESGKEVEIMRFLLIVVLPFIPLRFLVNCSLFNNVQGTLRSEVEILHSAF